MEQPADSPYPTNSDHPGSASSQRSRLRRDRLAAREALDAATHAAFSAAIDARLAALLIHRPAACIGFCWPIRKEFDARPLVLRLLAAGWQAVMPVVVQANAPMTFRHWSPDTPMTTDCHGIPVPSLTNTAPAPNILLVPLVAFDDAGYRLGYGGGYFDRTLANCVPRPITIGVGFELARVPTIYPEPHDQLCDFVITEFSGFPSQVVNF